MNYLIISVIVIFLIFNCNQQPAKIDGEIPITTSSDEALQLFLNGRELIENLKFPQAAILFEQSISLDSNFARAYLFRAFSGGGYKIYRENLEKAVKLIDNVSEGEKHEILYSEAYADEDGVKQKAELEKLLELFPNDKRVQDEAGNYFYYTAQDYSTALEYYKRVIEIDPNYAMTYNRMGYLYKDMGNHENAEKSFQKYIELIPDEANPYDSYAEYLLLQGRYDESIKQYQKSLETDPEYIRALTGIGNNYIFIAQFDKARDYFQQYFDKAFNLNQRLHSLYLKAISYVYEGDTDKSIKALEERIELGEKNNSPNYVVYSYLVAEWILDEVGRFEEGESYLRKAEEYIKTSDLNEADRNTYILYAGLDRCNHYIMTGDLKIAERDLKNLKQLVDQRQNPDEKHAIYMRLGMLETEKKNYKTALNLFLKADKESPWVWYWRALAHEKSGNLEEANTLYAKIGGFNENSMDLAVVRKKAQDKVNKMK